MCKIARWWRVAFCAKSPIAVHFRATRIKLRMQHRSQRLQILMRAAIFLASVANLHFYSIPKWRLEFFTQVFIECAVFR
jgi:hypothetical protein